MGGMSMERLTIRTCDDDICFSVDSDPDGAYDITDLVRYGYGDIALAAANRLAAYEDALMTADGVMSAEEVKAVRENLKAAKENHVDDYMRLQSEISALKSEHNVAVRALEMAKNALRDWCQNKFDCRTCDLCRSDYFIQQAKEDLQK
jgi:hypothetical protein